MKIIAMIPARYAATRFPAKLMQTLGNKTVIRHTYDNTVATGLFDEVWVVTDSDIIYQEIAGNGGKVVMSRKEHESGSDRIAEVIADMDIDVVVNVQGDEPFIRKEPLQALINLFKAADGEAVQVGSLMQPLHNTEQLNNPAVVKVAVNKNGYALYFSRSVIPYQRNTAVTVTYYKHIGVYGFRKQALLQFTQWPMGVLENIEKLEQLRYLENGIHLKMAVVNFEAVAIDTPEDLETARNILSQKKD
ncbi:MAG: 3-deoxy-manno-octulosonate cytidylyltransferase [Flavihumibacter sp.]|nr:3-deoxy-manno-octulosonate cytidylyltransferase [Flavihumibacter sp.]